MNWKTRRYCGSFSLDHVDACLELSGWVDTIRDHGQVLFIHLRDRSGMVQIVFDATKSPSAYADAQKLRPEYVVEIKGLVRERSADTKNHHLSTGDIEIMAETCEILSESETPPFMISEKEAGENTTTSHVDEDIRLTYRYLDLRRTSMQQNIIKRAQLIKTMRDYLDTFGFTEVETPVLTKSTPEGARDYLVPSRVHPGQFYALPQSPQLFKQLLMLSGLDRYFQIVKCFRDEDLRPNRQPEFTQLDLEASFIDESFIYELIEGLTVRLFAQEGITLQAPFTHIRYDDAMNRYGNDHPDLRFGLDMIDVTHVFKNTSYQIFKSIVGSGGTIKGLNIQGFSDKLSKSVLQEEFAKDAIQKCGGKGLSWMRMEEGRLQSNIVQFYSEEELAALIQTFKCEDGDVLVFVADKSLAKVNEVLGRFRVFLGERLKLTKPGHFTPCWVTDFPLFDYSQGKLDAVHHPFTQPAGDISGITDPKALAGIKARAYDLVINGEEVGGGSIRINRKDLQHHIFCLLGLSEADIKEKFGFFVDALSYGAPPHGGLALGVDRLVSMILQTPSIREVIAFPKNRMAYCPLTQAPSNVADKQLTELHLRTKTLQ